MPNHDRDTLPTVMCRKLLDFVDPKDLLNFLVETKAKGRLNPDKLYRRLAFLTVAWQREDYLIMDRFIKHWPIIADHLNEPNNATS